MTVVETMIRGVAVLAPLGARLDAGGCVELRRRMDDLLSRGQTLVVCDLSRVEFMDSTGLAVLLSAVKFLAGKGRLACAGITPQVRKLFSIVRLDQGLIAIHDTVEMAVAALAGQEEDRP
jgi:anti-sigma B factor antagonist